MAKFSEKEEIYLHSTITMLEEALELLGNSMLNTLLQDLEKLPSEDRIDLMKTIKENIYIAIADSSGEMASEYEAFKADPEVQAEVAQRMAEVESMFLTQGEEEDDEGNGNLQ